jgi:predicted small lipoprotein YifL
MHSKLKISLLILLVGSLLGYVGCGQKGDLYLPQPQKQSTEKPPEPQKSPEEKRN